MKKNTGALLIGSALSAITGQALASGFAVSEQSVSALGSAFSGAGVLSENASNQWYNPATLTGMQQTELSVAVHQLYIDTEFDADAPAAPGDFDDIDPTVGSAFLAVPLTDVMTFGLGLNAPFGTNIEYDNNWGNDLGGGTGSGDFYAEESDLKSYNINPALGIRLLDNLSVGVGVSYQKIDADIENALTRLEGDDDSYGWNIGATFSPDDNNHFGVAYRSEIQYEVDGDITFKDPTMMLGPLAGEYNAEADVDLPASFVLSYVGDITDNTQLLLGVDWMEWSSLDELEVEHEGPAPLPNPAVEEFDWKNTARYSAGLRHTMDNATVLRAGVAKEDSAQPGSERTSAVSPDSERYWVTLGATFVPADNIEVDLAYAHIFVDDADIKRTDKGVPLMGSYELEGDILGAQLNYRF